MPEFAYHAVDATGRASDGTMLAENEAVLEQRLRDVGYWLIEARSQTAQRRASGQRVPRRELIDFFNSMASLMTAGIPVAESFAAMAEETQHPTLRAVLEDIGMNVQAGLDVSSALGRFPRVFSPQVCSLVRAGEYGGNLVETFQDISAHLEWTDQIVADIKQASVYPSLVLAAVAGLIALMFIVVVPKFAEIFIELDIELPALTRGVMAVGTAAQSSWWIVVLGLIAAYVSLRMAQRRGHRVAMIVDRLKLKLPVFGPITSMLVQSQFVHNLGLMMRAGVPIIDALALCEGLTNNMVMDRAIADAQKEVQQGGRVSDALRAHAVVSSLTLRMIAVGEESGRLEESLMQVSQRFDAEIPRQIKRVFSLLEPAITLLLVGIVGLVAGSIFLPMFALATGIG